MADNVGEDVLSCMMCDMQSDGIYQAVKYKWRTGWLTPP